MVLDFNQTLKEALADIQEKQHHQFPVHLHEEERSLHNTDEIMEQYGMAKWALVELLNERFPNMTDLENWLHNRKEDEVAFFLNEAGSNVLSHSQFKAPATFHLWLGKKGFILGIEQKGKGFDAREVQEKKIKTNEGAAFDFFRTAKNVIFFDDPKEGRVVFMQVKVENIKDNKKTLSKIVKRRPSLTEVIP